MYADEIAIEMARLTRECEERVAQKIAAQQLGELFSQEDDMTTTHFFSSTGDAYDACQCREDIKDGDVLVIESERVVGVANCWPLAVTLERGELHQPADGKTLADLSDTWDSAAAVAEATRRGWAVRA